MADDDDADLKFELMFNDELEFVVSFSKVKNYFNQIESNPTL